MTDKPLHVRVAEALGWVLYDKGEFMLPGGRGILGYPPGAAIIGHPEQVPWFDTDWSATGLLIERYGIDLSYYPHDVPMARWEAFKGPEFVGDAHADGATPLIAVCNLILALHAAGKLAA